MNPIRLRRRHPEAASRERGQMLLLFALLVVPVSLGIGVVAVDVSLWQSERRGAQKDADFSALAGAFELLDTSPSAADAQAEALASANTNDEADNASIIGGAAVVDSSCFGGGSRLDSVTVDIDHDSRTLFSDAFGFALAPEIGAHARACAGSITGASGLRPYGVESEPVCLGDGTCEPPADDDCFQLQGGIYVPRFGAWCELDDGSQDPSTSERGLLDLATDGDDCSDGGNDDIDVNVQDGAGGFCEIGDPVDPTTGARPGQDINRGIEILLAGGGNPDVADGAQCDARFGSDSDSFDDFEEVLDRIDGGPPGPSPTAVFQLRDCLSPRIVNVIIIDNFAASPPTVQAFASFYILGCKTPSQPLTVLPNRCASGPPGQLQLWGIFFNKLELEGDVGEFNPFGTHAITLDE